MCQRPMLHDNSSKADEKKTAQQGRGNWQLSINLYVPYTVVYRFHPKIYCA